MENEIQATRGVKAVAFVLWPSFLTAALASILFFAYFDPLDLYLCNSSDQEDCRYNIYTVGFLLFWALTLLTCLLTCYFRQPCVINRKPS